MPTLSSIATETISVETAAQLLRELDPQHARWQGEPQRWLFRGHWDATWALLPAAYRLESWQAFRRRNDDALAPHVQEGLAANGLLEFARRLDESGLSIPGHHRLEDLRLDATIQHQTVVDRSDLWPFVALAQHHGLPTALLDWTRVAQFAAYFAASSDVPADTTKQFAVWALSERFVRHAESDLDSGGPSNPEIRLVTVPRASNPNLHAQAGVFIIWQRAEQGLSLDEAVEVWKYRQAGDETGPIVDDVAQSPVLYRFEVPQSEASELLRLLAYYNVDAARLFPGCAGVVRAIQEQGLEPNP